MAQTLYASVSYKKVPGTLTLVSDGILTWKPSSTSASVREFQVSSTYLKGMQVSKPGAAQIALRLVAKEGKTINGDTSAFLVFNADVETAVSQREKFKERLAAAIAQARMEPMQRTKTSGIDSHDSLQRTPMVSEVALRSQVLRLNPQLLALHKEVVGSGTLSDADFWAHPARVMLLRAEKARMQQKTGRRGQLADPHPTQNENNELKINITPQLIRDLFEQYPVLTRAYDENVPNRLDENTFWARYFQSKLYHRLRTSLRSAASEHQLPADDIFDKYLEAEDNDLEPRQKRNPHDALLNLASTEEDHSATGNIQDWTMRPGFDRRTLSLVRRFNKHAESLLTSSLGALDEKDARRVRRKVGGVDEEYDSQSKQRWESHYDKDIVIPDLTERQSRGGRRLEIQDSHVYYGSDMHEKNEAVQGENLFDYAQFRQDLAQWHLDLSKFSPSGPTMSSTLHCMLKNMGQQKEQRYSSALDKLPPDVYRQIVSCQAATSEFLQQFWQAALPSLEHTYRSVDQRVEKAENMISILQKTDTRIENVAAAADAAMPNEGYDSVMEAFQATREAVQAALVYANKL